jgi:hypothetical protein
MVTASFMSSRRHSQDPEGPKARAFRRWLKRNPEHRWRALRRRLEHPDEDAEILGWVVFWVLVVAWVGLGIWRLFGGEYFL